ncbi:MAG: hypothetical protein RR450_08270, partial [Oscillospiraceae bacterium]
YEMARFLARNGVQVEVLTKDVTVDKTVYHKGDLVVNMHQAKRNYANAVLWQGADASNSGFPDLYSESVSNFPAMRGFDCVGVVTKDAFKGSTAVLKDAKGASQFSGVKDKAVILANNGQETVRAVNELLAGGKAVGLVTAGSHKGDFVLSYRDYQTVSAKYVLVATGVEKTPVARAIAQPKLYLAGRFSDATAGTVTEGYYANWFKDGYGVVDYRNMGGNNSSNYDLMAYEKQLGFHLVSD